MYNVVDLFFICNELRTAPDKLDEAFREEGRGLAVTGLIRTREKEKEKLWMDLLI